MQAIPFTTRILTNDITNVQQIIQLDNVREFPDQGPFVIKIGSEQLLVIQTLGEKFLTNRGVNGTSKASHSKGAVVFPIITTVNPAQFVQHVDQ